MRGPWPIPDTEILLLFDLAHRLSSVHEEKCVKKRRPKTLGDFLMIIGYLIQMNGHVEGDKFSKERWFP